MPEHVLEAGRDVIQTLAALGRALGYEVELEWELPDGTAAVDIAWLRERNDRAPLFVFEIESRPGEGLASNAMKVLGRDASGGPKPLHLFHIVVRGGLRSRRPVDTAREFAGHNYTVHLLASRDEPLRLLDAVLQAHRRVSSVIDGIAVASVLRSSIWRELSADAVVQAIDSLRFSGVRGLPIATLAANDAEFLVPFRRHLLETWGDVLQQRRDPPNRYFGSSGHVYVDYGSYMAYAACEGIELGLIARLAPEHAEAAFAALRGWQAANHIGDSPGPFTGTGTQWTEYALMHLGYYWALIGALFAEDIEARAWCATQPLKLVEELGKYPSLDRALLALWTMHTVPADERFTALYDRAAAAVRDVGGLAVGWVRRPQPAGPGPDADDEAWEGIVVEGDVAVPSKRELVALVRDVDMSLGDPVELAVSALIEDPAARPDDGDLLVSLFAEMDYTLGDTK